VAPESLIGSVQNKLVVIVIPGILFLMLADAKTAVPTVSLPPQ